MPPLYLPPRTKKKDEKRERVEELREMF